MKKADLPAAAEPGPQAPTLGRKGTRTRLSLMAAARKLLEAHSPVELTAVAIAKEAGISSASFYMYFEDTRDVLYALAEEAGAAMAAVLAVVEKPWESRTLHLHARELVGAFNAVWEIHRRVLCFRNLEADRGDPRFEALRMATYVPFIDQLARRMQSASPPGRARPTLGQAFGLASVVHASMERLAMAEPAVVARALGARKVNEALAHMIQLMFLAGAPVDGPMVEAAVPARRTRRSAAGCP